MVTAFKEGAEAAGKSVTVFRTADMTIGGCLGCSRCFADKITCVQRDDMDQIWEALKQADAIVFASPVYFFGVSAQLKLAIDRTYSLPNVPNTIKKAAMLLSCGDSTGNAAEGALVMHKWMLDYRQWEDGGVVLIPGVGNGIAEREELAQARKLGEEI